MTELSGEPAYRQVANDLRRQIQEGALAAGSRLPSLTQLTATYGASSTVIKAAINELRADGLVVGQQGKGVFVREPNDLTATREGSEGLSLLTDQVKALRVEVQQVNERLAAVEERVGTGKPQRRR